MNRSVIALCILMAAVALGCQQSRAVQSPGTSTQPTPTQTQLTSQEVSVAQSTPAMPAPSPTVFPVSAPTLKPDLNPATPAPVSRPENRPPQIIGPIQAAPAEVLAAGKVQLQAIAQDPDGDPLTFSWSQSPAQPAGQFSNHTSATPMWIAPDVGQATVFTLGVRVDDGRGGQTQGQVQVKVNPAVSPAVRQLFRFWQDPNEMAFKVLIPVGWDVSGGIQRVNTDLTYQLEARKGKARFFLQNPVPVQHWAPTQYTAMMGYREGTYIPALGFQFFLLRYHPPRQYINNIILPGLKQLYPDARIVETIDLPEVARAYKDPSATNAEAASAVIAFTDGGIPMMAGYTVWTDYFAGPEGSAAWVARVVGTIAPEADFQAITKLLAWALSTIRIEPAWLQAEIKGSASRRAMVSAAANKIREMEYNMFTEERNINLKIGGNWMDALGPNFHAHDKSGNPVVLPNPGAGKEWGMNGKGDFDMLDRDKPDPKGEFKAIQRIP